MLNLVNHSALIAQLYPGFNAQGQAQFTCVVKASIAFTLAGKCELMTPAAIVEQDDWQGEANVSGLMAADETVPFKQGAEIILYGRVSPPHPHYRALEVGLGLDSAKLSWEKQLRIYGERHWQLNRLKATISYPGSLTALNLDYTHAYGGQCPKRQRAFTANPAGQGFITTTSAAHLVKLPQIELLHRPLKRAMQRQQPAGFGPIPMQWSPRSQRVPKQAWQAIESGKMPEGMNLPNNFYNCAPADQQFAEAFQGDEILHLQGLIAGAKLHDKISVNLPQVMPKLTYVSTSDSENIKLVCDTCVVDTSAQRIDLIWRAGIAQSKAEQMGVALILTDKGAAHD